MAFDPILLWLALASAVVVLARGGGPLWQAKAVLVIGVGAILVAWFPEVAGWITGVAGLALIGVPALLAQLVDRLIVAQRFAITWPIGVLAWLSHPERRGLVQIRTLRALAWARRGRTAAALALLDRVARDATAPPRMALIARMHKARLEESWDSLLAETDWARAEPNLATLIQLRGFSATARVRELVALQSRDGERLAALRGTTPAIWAFGLLALLSGCGRTASLDRLLVGPLRMLPKDLRALSRAVGGLAAGGAPAARAEDILLHLEQAADRDVAAQARRERAGPRPPAQLDAREREVIERAERTLDDYIAARAARPSPRRAPVTLTLIALNLAAYGLEYFLGGGGEDTDALLRLGALWPPAVLVDGEWWRVATASFLHFGWLHLGMNMLALLMIGAATERAYGWWRMLAVYVVSGLGAMLCVISLAWLGWSADEVVVGASGAIMGLVGALVAVAARAWWRGRTRAARLRLLWLLGVIALQSVLDVATPEISFAGHASGVLLGFCVGLPLARRAGETPAPPPAIAATRGAPARWDRRRLIVALGGGAVAGIVAVVFPRRREAAITRRLAGSAPN